MTSESVGRLAGETDGAVSRQMHDQFFDQGYIGPIRVLSAQECQRFLKAARGTQKEPPMDWAKGHAAGSRAFYEIGTQTGIIDVVAALLGKDVMLWGASLLHRPPDAVHAWHTDIESSSAPSGKTVSVWVGIENTNRNSSLLMIPYSHSFGETIQEVRYHLGEARDETSNDEIVHWAQERDRRSHLIAPEMTDGEALFFDGHLWHGSHNLSRKTRWALILQYATPDTKIRIPDLNHLDWPFRQLDLPRPACLMVRGSDKSDVNRFVSPPVAARVGSNQLTSRVYPLYIPLLPDQEEGWKPYPIFNGSSANMKSLACHSSVLTHDSCPHPPHIHKEEELLLLLSGEVDLILPDMATPNGDQRKRLKRGQFVYYPAHFAHTLQTVSEEPANYLMFKWHTNSTETVSPLGFGQFNLLDPAQDSEVKEEFCPRLLFKGPTTFLRKLSCHTSTLTPGAGYDPHIDAYDLAIIVLEGEIETLGERMAPHSVIFYPAGEPHGIRNPGEVIAKYIVFEFHGSQSALADTFPNPSSSLLAKLIDPQCWKRKLRHLIKRFSNRVSQHTGL